MWGNESFGSDRGSPPPAASGGSAASGSFRDSGPRDSGGYGGTPPPVGGYGTSPPPGGFGGTPPEHPGGPAAWSPPGHRRVPSGGGGPPQRIESFGGEPPPRVGGDLPPRIASFGGGHRRIPSGNSAISNSRDYEFSERQTSERGVNSRGGFGGPSPQTSPAAGHLRAREGLPDLPRPEGLDRGDLSLREREHSLGGIHGQALTVPTSHQRISSGGSRHTQSSYASSGAGLTGLGQMDPAPVRHFGHRRVDSGTSNSSGVCKSIVTPCHNSSRALAGYYDMVSDLGKGSFGVVTMVKERTTSQERVQKSVSTAGLGHGVLEMVRKEVDLLCQLDHPHVVKLFEYVEDHDRQQLVLILEYVPGGSCANLLKTSWNMIQEATVSSFIYQALSALAYCHSQSVAHRDVKPEHMMLTVAGLWGQQQCKLIDFGLGAFTMSASSQDFVGTPEYMAPEVVSRTTDDATKTDVWSIGISAIELLTSTSPFGKPIELGSNDPVYANIRRYNNFADIEPLLTSLRGWTSRTEEARDFAYWLLVKDPAARPTAAEAINHPWMQEHREKRASLTRDMISSMHGYIEAHKLVRCCLYVIAARTEVPNRERLEAAFVFLDSDRDGEISSQDLAGALAKPAEWWDTSDLMSVLTGSPSFDPDALIAAADLDGSSGLSFTEFAATCLYTKQDTPDGLVRRAFEALDDDRDGQIHATDIFELFQELEFNGGLLPEDKPISMTEWCALFNESFTQPTYQRKVVVRKKMRGWC